MFERPLILWLLAATPLMAIPGVIAMRAGRPFAGALSAVLRMGLFAALILMLAGARLPLNISRTAHGRGGGDGSVAIHRI